ncbi:hypothetical protein [Mycobacterium sp. 1164966.3]|uniref:hypothetical protein n=1 Tax=Mycobacterium sp. 1164966.3 TaxID=1856861 RepID=UPI000AA990DE|nr:hypothetical protein [Mycobacterium sp. 1164966.3]
MGSLESAPDAGLPGHAGTTPPDFDHLPVVNQLENNLQAWLNRPVQDILDQFNLGQLPTGGPDYSGLSGEGIPANLTGAPGAGGMGTNFTGGLLRPITDMLGTLGPGIFQGLNPTQMFGGVSQAFQSAAGGLQQALSQMAGGMGGQGWAGAGAGAAAARTGETLANGAAVAGQGTALAGHYTAAAANVEQGHARLIEILTQCQHELEALSAGLPWTAPNMVESASRATALATECITELESTLTTQAAATSATGAPLAIAQGPEMAMGMVGPMLSVGMSMIGPALSMGAMPLTMGVQAGTQALQAGLQAGTGLISSVGQAPGTGATSPAAALGHPARMVSATHPTGGGHAGGGGGPVATTPARTTPSSPMVQNENNAATLGRSVVARPAVGGAGMSGAGMMAPGAGYGAHGGKAGASGSHTSASFLHTTDQGGEIVGDLGNASPPVIGETASDPDDSPDIKLQI